MNPRRLRYCLLAAALAVALWRLPGVGSTAGGMSGGLFSSGLFSAGPFADDAPKPAEEAQAPPATVGTAEEMADGALHTPR
jgi:hypothetical protein